MAVSFCDTTALATRLGSCSGMKGSRFRYDGNVEQRIGKVLPPAGGGSLGRVSALIG